MIKAELTDGTNIFVVKIEHYVTLSIFTKVLGIEFYDEISQEVEEIIKDSEGRFGTLTQVYDSKLD